MVSIFENSLSHLNLFETQKISVSCSFMVMCREAKTVKKKTKELSDVYIPSWGQTRYLCVRYLTLCTNALCIVLSYVLLVFASVYLEHIFYLSIGDFAPLVLCTRYKTKATCF